MEFKADAPTWYAAALGGLLSFLLALRFVHLASVIIYARLKPGILARLVYSEGPPPFRSLSRLAVMFGLAYIAANAVPLAVGTASLREAGSRAGLMALANLVFLTLGPLSLVAGCFGWSLTRQRHLHACVGFVASLEVLVHVVVAISLDEFHLSRLNILGVAAGGAFATSCFFGILLLQGALYELALLGHSLLWKLVITALWIHISPTATTVKVLRILTAAIPLATLLWTWLRIAWRNFSWTRGRTVASIHLVGDSLQLTITSPRPWTVVAGQYVYLTVPRASAFSVFQRHPFSISWWRRVRGSLEVTLLVQPRDGFTKDLQRLVDSDVCAWIDGPYGCGHDLGDFGTVVLFSTGIGIWSHLLHVKQLVKGYQQGRAKAKSIRLHWRVDRDGQQRDAKLIMDKLLEDDRVERRLEICIYVPDKHRPHVQSKRQVEMTERPKRAAQSSRRVFTVFEEPDVKTIVEKALPKDGRRVAISVSAYDSFGTAFKKALAESPPGDVSLDWEEFQPPGSRPPHGQPPPVERDHHMSFQCRGNP